ncbi:MAG: amidohydrolase family protein [Candidatus Latescibacteria bacterium]|nr:amidohydrolase family protein [Candidatus Latescibacterota bacterium]
MSDTLIRAGWLIDGTGAPPQADVDVLIRDGKVESVSPRGGSPKGVRVVDAPEATLLPGLVDAHLHLAYSGPNPTWNAVKDKPDLLLAWAGRNCRLALASGLTTVGDCGAPRMAGLRLREALRLGLFPGPRVQVCDQPISTTCGHTYDISLYADHIDEIRKAVRYLCQQRVDFIKVMATGGSMDPETNRRRASYTVEEMRAVVEEAHRLYKRVVAHVNGTEGIRNAVWAGVDQLAHCNWLGVEDGTIEYDEEVAAQAARQGTWVDFNINAGINPLATGDGKSEDWSRWENPPRTRWDLVDRMRKMGAPVLLSSDAVGANYDRLITYLPKLVAAYPDLRPEEAVHMATLAPARCMGLGEETGSIEPGKSADLLLARGDATDGLKCLPDIERVYLRGVEAVRYEEGQVWVGGAT